MRLGYVIVYVPNITEAVEFYGAAFGLSARFVHESGYAEMETGVTALAFATEALGAHNGVAVRPNRMSDAQAAGVEIAFVVPDIEAAFRRAIDAGAAAVAPPTDKPWGQTVAYVRDLNGFLVELCTPAGAAT